MGKLSLWNKELLMIPIVHAIMGFLLLVAGRKLYWLFVGVIGFMLGVYFASSVFTSESEIVWIVIALITGVIGTMLAFFAQRLAIAVAGFISGGLIIHNFSVLFDPNLGVPEWIFFIVGGIIGVILISVLFDWALMILSSLLGANLLVGLINLKGWMSLIVTVFLFVIGLSLQARGVRKI
jgi:hypothetical protein